ncbi:MAG: glycosyltransferase family 39 protein [Gemmataceae bacterium]|nr:glycosyltransferase family 39 protein [Gemmataceae bacterium]
MDETQDTTAPGSINKGTGWRDLGSLVLLLLVAGGIHVWMVLHAQVAARDSVGFIRYALALESQPWRQALPQFEQHPVYPLAVLALSLPIRHQLGTTTDSMVLSAQWTSALAGILLVIPMFCLGRELFDRRVGFWAALLFQCLPVSAAITSDALSDPVFYLMATTALYLGVLGMRTRLPWVFALCGIVISLAYLTRPEGALIGFATFLTLLGVQLLPATRWSWREVNHCLSRLILTSAIVAVPYMAVIGGVTVKPTGKKLLGTSDLQDTLPPVSQRAPGQPLFAMWWNDRQHYDRPPLQWALWALGHETARASQYILWLPGLLGLWWFRGRLRAQPGTAIVLLLGLMYASLLGYVAMKVGYLSDRHTLFLVLLGIYWAVATLLALGDAVPGWIEKWRGRSVPQRWQPAIAAGACLVLAVAFLPWALRPLHANRAGHRAAGLWLSEHIQPGDEITDPFEWARYYSGKTLREGAMIAPAPGHQPVRYIVLEKSTNQHSRLVGIKEARQAVEGREPVFEWVPTARARKDRAEEVVIYACPVGN